MRWLVPLSALAVLALAPSAFAAPISVGPVSISPEFQRTLERTYGADEAGPLESQVADAISRALSRAGAEVTTGAPVTVETTILDADPNLPTMKELIDKPGLSYIDSISVGGASLHAVIRGADGHTIAEVDHRHYSQSIQDIVAPPGPWQDAQRAIRSFAEKVARAYVASAQ